MDQFEIVIALDDSSQSSLGNSRRVRKLPQGKTCVGNLRHKKIIRIVVEVGLQICTCIAIPSASVFPNHFQHFIIGFDFVGEVHFRESTHRTFICKVSQIKEVVKTYYLLCLKTSCCVLPHPPRSITEMASWLSSTVRTVCQEMVRIDLARPNLRLA